ncbi:MAG: hypothetical protein ABSH36_17900 [Solirubrobacteraceae bacterium]
MSAHWLDALYAFLAAAVATALLTPPVAWRTSHLHLMRYLLASRIMPRTTLDLDASVLRELRRRGTREHKSMGQVASEVLAAGLRGRTPKDLAPLAWSSRHMGRPRIDLEDREALGRVLDEEYLLRLEGGEARGVPASRAPRSRSPR